MSERDPDLLLKRVWLINGFLLLLLAAGGLLAVLWALTSGLFAGDPGVRAEREAGAQPHTRRRAVRFDPPARVRGTSTQLVVVYNGRADEIRVVPSGEGYAASGAHTGPMVNVVFVDSGKPEGRLLLDRPAYISDLHSPSVDDRYSRDTLQTWISYEIALADTNHDGELDGDDDSSLWVSALDGTGLRRATPEGVHVVRQWVRPDRHSIGIIALQAPGGGRHAARDEMPQRALVYDVPSGRLSALAEVERPLARAAEILGR